MSTADGEPWPPARVARLRELWGKGLTASAIAAELRTTKNAVNSKVDRLDLPGRPSPIVRRRPEEIPVLPPQVLRRKEAGHNPLPPFHPIAAEVLAEARRR